MAAAKSRSRRNLEMGLSQVQLGPPAQQKPAVVGQAAESAMQTPNAHHSINLAGLYGLGSQANNPGTAPSGGGTSTQQQEGLTNEASSDVSNINESGAFQAPLPQRAITAVKDLAAQSAKEDQERLKRLAKIPVATAKFFRGSGPPTGGE